MNFLFQYDQNVAALYGVANANGKLRYNTVNRGGNSVLHLHSLNRAKTVAAMHLIAYVEKMSNYVYSFYSAPAQDPYSTQIDELMESIRAYAGEDFDESLIEDVSMVWVDYRGGRRGFWRSVDLRFVMVLYKGEWCWWPYY